MPKINFKKVEQELEATLAKFHFEYIIGLEEVSASFGGFGVSDPKKAMEHAKRLNRFALRQMKHGLKSLVSHKKYIKKLNIKKEELKKYMDSEGELTPEERAKVQAIIEKVREFQKEIQKKILPQEEEYVKTRIKKATYLRHNVKPTWLPLH